MAESVAGDDEIAQEIQRGADFDPEGSGADLDEFVEDPLALVQHAGVKTLRAFGARSRAFREDLAQQRTRRVMRWRRYGEVKISHLAPVSGRMKTQGQ